LAEEYIEYKNKNSIPAVLLSLIYRKHEQGINSAEKFQQSYYLTKTKIELEHRKEELNNWKNKLEDESKRLENLCSSDDQNKIAIIAASILRKNLPFSKNFEKEKKKFTELH
jgi:type IV secretory pathway VirB4 component